MHYYTRHIGDYAKNTGHLSLIEHGIYTVLLDWAYATEKSLPMENEAVYRLCRAVTAQEKRFVDRVVNEFFPVTDGERRNERAMVEIFEFRSKSEKSKLAAQCRWNANAHANAHANALPTDSERTADGMPRARVPITNNQYPITSTHTPESARGKIAGKNFPELQEAVEHFAAAESAFSPAQVKTIWHDCNATIRDGNWVAWDGKTVVGDWRSHMESRLAQRFPAQPPSDPRENKKIAADFLGVRSPKQARFEMTKELEDVTARLDALHEIGAERDLKDEKRERELKAMIKNLEVPRD